MSLQSFKVFLSIMGFLIFVALPVYGAEICRTNLTATDKFSDLSEILTCLQNRIEQLENTKQTLVKENSQVSTSGFLPGEYIGLDKEISYIVVSGPRNVNGREQWFVRNNDRSFQATWYTGPKKGNPALVSYVYESKLPEGNFYGSIGTVDRHKHKGLYYSWLEGYVIHAFQLGNELVLTMYNNEKVGPTLSLTRKE